MPSTSGGGTFPRRLPSAKTLYAALSWPRSGALATTLYVQLDRAVRCQGTASQRELPIMKISRSMLAGAGILALSCVSALAQQVTGVPGSPGATTTIDGKQLPPIPPKFGG